jgi:hypothetical protein
MNEGIVKSWVSLRASYTELQDYFQFNIVKVCPHRNLLTIGMVILVRNLRNQKFNFIQSYNQYGCNVYK